MIRIKISNKLSEIIFFFALRLLYWCPCSFLTSLKATVNIAFYSKLVNRSKDKTQKLKVILHSPGQHRFENIYIIKIPGEGVPPTLPLPLPMPMMILNELTIPVCISIAFCASHIKQLQIASKCGARTDR